jgi:aminopeptidase-like protein
MTVGKNIYLLAKNLWPINRSITGNGVRKTLSIIKRIIPELNIFEIKSGTKVFDWTIPKEWNVNDAYIITPKGKKICSFKKNNLHLVGYSTPLQKKLNLIELQKHLHSLPNQPDAIPYVTSYYKERWGFCISQKQREKLEDGQYEVYIDSELSNGSLTYGELIIKGQLKKEIFLSTYVCHPSMANNELSGPSVVTYIAKWLLNKSYRRFSYRIIFVPETIGSIAYLSKNKKKLISKVIAGFNVSCIGDNRNYSYLPSRNGKTLSDLVAKHVLKNISTSFKSYKWKDRGSDERQYCSPGIDLPIASIMRTKYGEYPEYHTSLDDLKNVVTIDGLEGGYKAIKYAIEILENNKYPKIKVFCEPQLSKRDLYPDLSAKNIYGETDLLMNLITYSDGKKSLLEIAEILEVPMWRFYPLIKKLLQNNLLDLKENYSKKF